MHTNATPRLRRVVTLTAGVFILSGCATQHRVSPPPLVPVALINPPPKLLPIPSDPLDQLSPAVRVAYLRGERGPIRDGFTWQFAYNPHVTETIYCSPLHVSEIVLSSDEHIVSSAVGDSDRWVIDAQGNHLLIKPTPPGHGQSESYSATIATVPVEYSTNLIAETDRRTYHFMLQSTPHRWMEQTTFFYPDDIRVARAARDNAMNEAAKQVATAPVTDTLNFSYRITGANVPWRPVQVFTDRSHTYIQFSDSAPMDGDMPALFADDGGTQVMVNYATRGNAYVADRVLSQAALAEGTGTNRQVVHIEAR